MLRVAFFDVGQGDSSALLLPGQNTAVIIDCAPRTKPLVDYLVAAGVERIERIFLSHTDLDHIGGIDSFLTNFLRIGEIGCVTYSHDRLVEGSEGRRRTILRTLLQLHELQGLQLDEAYASDAWDFGDVKIRVVHPNSADRKWADAYLKPNDASLVLHVTYGDRQVLFTGDAMGRSWKQILTREPGLRAHVLKFPHHGAWYERQKGEPSLRHVLRRIRPELVIISVGSSNGYGHPDPRTMRMLRALAHVQFACTQPTAQCYSSVASRRGPFSCKGSIEVTIDHTARLSWRTL
jgi:competence protein ComEC